jgi:TonB family protein
MTHLGPSLRRAKVRERPGRRLAVAAAASILLNALAFLLLARAGAFQVGTARPARVALAPVSRDQWAANRAIGPNAGAPRKPNEPLPFAMPRPPARPPPDQARPDGQVVDVAPSPDSTPPKSARFLSDRDNTVEKETRSRHARAGYERTLATPQAPGVRSAPMAGENGTSAKAVPGLEGRPAAPEAPEAAPRLALAPGSGDGLAVGGTAPEEGAPAPGGTGEGGQRREGAPSDVLSLTPGTLARMSGGPAPDRLEGVEEGEGTYLNTRSWKYATYFNRIKQAVAAAWDPMPPLDARDPDRSMFGHKDRFTLLGVTLDDSGHVKNLVVEQTSGADFLDRAALTAFRSAQPFVNPPRGIIDGNGEIKFSFGFFLEVGRQGMRIYRAPIPAMP